MKKNKNFIITGILLLSMSLSAQDKISIEYFTTIEKIYNIELGMTPAQVNSELGIEPFDIYQNLENGELILEYRYKHKYIRNNVAQIYYQSNMNQGEVYYDKPSSLFMIFDSNRTLTSYYTESGKQSAKEAYKWENTMLMHNKNIDCKDCRVLIAPDSKTDLVEIAKEKTESDKAVAKAESKAAAEVKAKAEATKVKKEESTATIQTSVTVNKPTDLEEAKSAKPETSKISESSKLLILMASEKELTNQILVEKDLKKKGKLSNDRSDVRKAIEKQKSLDKKAAEKKAKEDKKAAEKNKK